MAFEPHSITREHVLQAISKIRAEEVELIPSTRWDVLIEDERYPPKEVLRHAHQEMNGEFLWEHSGGSNTNNYLKKLGFNVVEKSDLSAPIKVLIQKYKENLRQNKLSDAVYKWKLVRQFHGRPNLDAPDFTEEVKSINYYNLIYGVGIGVMHLLAKERPEPYRGCFRILFNEVLPLADRLKRFSAETLKLYRDIEPNSKLSHHHDERTMATLLTFYNADRYTFYKDSFYQKYCKLLGIKAKKVGKKYLHYLDLLDSFISDYLEPDTELLYLVNESLPEDAFKDEGHKLLAQDILYRTLEGDLSKSQDASFEKDEEALRDIIKKSSSENLSFFFQILDRLIEDLSIPDEPNVVFSTSDRLSFHVGRRFCLNLEGDWFYFIAPKDYIIEGIEKTNFDGTGHPAWFHRASAGIVTQHYPAIREAVQVELERDKHTQPKDYDNAAFRKATYDKDYRETLFDFNENKAMVSETKKDSSGRTNMPLNQIIYGPPGTGKTYNTINKALEILGVQTYGIPRSEVKKKFEERVAAGEIVFTTFHQSMSYEEFVEGIKPQEAFDKEGNTIVTYKVKPGVFKSLCSVATVKEGSDDFDDVYEQFAEDLQSSSSLLLHTPRHNKPFKVSVNSNKNCVARPETDTATPMVITKDMIRDFLFYGKIRDWKPYTLSISDHLRKKYSLSIAPQEKQEKDYVLIIDEINRGNVSQIFGELITLIEEDKRLGGKEQLEVTLPYSKEKFGVPSNLYIIGTMNTADRSVEALDTALRRRFSFVEMPPRYDLPELDTEAEGYKLKDILLKMNRRIEKLLGKDNLIGHSYFIDVKTTEELREALQNKIIPLLQEYFYGDYGKIGLVLGEGFFRLEEGEGADIFASFGNYDSSGLAEKDVYHLAELVGEKRLTDEAFRVALDKLMK